MQKEKLDEMKNQLVGSLLFVGDTFKTLANKISEVDMSKVASTLEKYVEDLDSEMDNVMDKIEEAVDAFEGLANEEKEKEKEQKEETTTK